MDGPKVLAEAVKKARYDLRLRQEDVEARRGPSTATLRIIESGKIQSPRPRTLRALDDALGWAEGTAAALLAGRATEAVSHALARRLDRADPTLTQAAAAAPRALGEFIGDAVAMVLMDHVMDEHPDPNIHELAHCVLMLGRLGGGGE